jgi:hypothetical protein
MTDRAEPMCLRVADVAARYMPYAPKEATHA